MSSEYISRIILHNQATAYGSKYDFSSAFISCPQIATNSPSISNLICQLRETQPQKKCGISETIQGLNQGRVAIGPPLRGYFV